MHHKIRLSTAGKIIAKVKNSSFTQNDSNDDLWFLPNALEITSEEGLRSTVEYLLETMKQVEILEQLDIVSALREVMEAVFNDSCSYVSCYFGKVASY